GGASAAGRRVDAGGAGRRPDQAEALRRSIPGGDPGVSLAKTGTGRRHRDRGRPGARERLPRAPVLLRQIRLSGGELERLPVRPEDDAEVVAPGRERVAEDLGGADRAPTDDRGIAGRERDLLDRLEAPDGALLVPGGVPCPGLVAIDPQENHASVRKADRPLVAPF